MTSNQAAIHSTAAHGSPESIEARAQADGMLDAEGFFTQSDWEFELDSLQDTSRESLLAHLAKAPPDSDTAVVLKGYLTQSRDITFTPF